MIFPIEDADLAIYNTKKLDIYWDYVMEIYIRIRKNKMKLLLNLKYQI